MSAKLLDGKVVSEAYRGELAKRIAKLKEQGVTPGLGVILVGDNPASLSYVKGKDKACRDMGLRSDQRRLEASSTEDQILAEIESLNSDPGIHGILVQLPLPKGLDSDRILTAISPEKDADGFHPINVGNMILNKKAYLPCTPHGVIVILEHYGIKIEGSHVVIVGRSDIVGKPLSNLLVRKSSRGNATVTVCHTGTPDIGVYSRQADIVVAAAGRPELVTADMVREGAVVIDVGINRVEDASRKRGYRLVGDVDFDAVSEKASYITPVPGGVGPMTITMLISNTVESAERTLG